jgi:hypothetical protein
MMGPAVDFAHGAAVHGGDREHHSHGSASLKKQMI